MGGLAEMPAPEHTVFGMAGDWAEHLQGLEKKALLITLVLALPDITKS